MKNTLKAALLVSSALITTPVLAQQQPTPPEHYTLNSQGVDLVQGTFNYSTVDVAIGPQGQGGLAHGRVWANNGWRDTLSGTIAVSGSTYVVSLGAQSEVFTKSGSNFIPASNNGSTLSQSGSGVTFTASDGTVATYSTVYNGSTTPYQANNAALMSVVSPNGERLDYHWSGVTYCIGYSEIDEDGNPAGNCLQFRNAVRLEGVSNNLGYAIDFLYASDTPPEDGLRSVPEWLRRTGVRGVNRAVDACTTYPSGCDGLTQPWPSIQYDAGEYGGVIMTATDQAGRTTTYTYTGNRLSGVRLPGESADAISVIYDATGKVSQATDASGAWTYAYSDSGTTRTTTATGPLGQQQTIASNLSIGRATAVTVATSPTMSVTTSYSYDSQRRLERVTRPEGDYSELMYDGRGNVTRALTMPKGEPSLLNAIMTFASYPSSCTNPRICNQPTSTTDARGAVTNYEYDANHGGLLSVTAPAPTAGAVRPQTRIAYAAQTAYFKNNVGNFAASPTSIVLPVSVSSCATNAAPACVGTVDEVRQTIQYGSTGVANNLLPTVVTQSDGTGALSASGTTAYTANGDVASVDGPLPGAEDTTYYRYDTARRPVGVIGPDPDGSGSLMRRAQRVTYDAGSRPTQVDVGAVNGISDGDWNGFVSLQQQLTAYDGFGRPVTVAQHGGGQAHAVTQVSYDAAGRQACVAQRMNPAAFNSLPGSACELGAAGAYGPDRITSYQYDAAGRLNQSTSGYLSGSPITEQATYTANGKPLTLKDGAGNVSTMVYDGFDRLSQLRYPDATTGIGTSSTSDYEQYGYDANSNVTSFRNRAGETEARTYDAGNRIVSVVRSAAPATAWTYDNLNRPLTISGNNIAQGYGWDALGRQTRETTPLGTVSYGYDLAGRRTSMSWPDGFWVAYDYNLVNELTAIRENGAPDWSLTSWAYDNLGRPIAQSRANGAWTTWGYDGASRLASLSQDLAGTANDLTLSFSYNPAGQIVSRTMSNPAYAYTPGTGNTAYANNGKNQVTSVNGASVGYDGRQNITSIPGGGSYGYDGLNQLTTANTSGLVYDPSGRLFQISSGNVATRFLYDGQQAISEYDQSGTLLKRYVPGLGLDNVITAYEGATYDRRYLLADERGSVVSITDGAANALTTNTYDEYGVPSAANSGRFQYTGQMWMPQAQLYHYRARAYAPQLGRFMQTDPIGYGDGANVYAYVGADPLNLYDPLGLDGKHLPGGESECYKKNGYVVVTVSKGVDHNECHTTTPFGGGSLGGAGSGVGTGGGATVLSDIVVVSQRRNNNCDTPRAVHLDGKFAIAAFGGGFGQFSGTLQDVSTGRTYSVSAGLTFAAGASLGVYEINGTLNGSFNVLGNSFGISFATGGYGPLSLSTAFLRAETAVPGEYADAGPVNVGGLLSAPGGLGWITFNNVTTTLKEKGSCK